MLLEELRRHVLQVGLRMVEDGVARGSQGNVSAIDSETGLIVITPSAIPYGKLQAEDICVVDREGKIVESKWKPTSEIALHLIFYQQRSDVKAVVHSHAPYSTVFGVIYEPIPLVLAETAMILNAPVPVAPYARPGTKEVAQVTFESMLPDKVAAVMAHHGLVTVGPNLEAAYESTIAVETTARIVMMAYSMGGTIHALDLQECRELRQIYLASYKAKSIQPGGMQ
jgi:L-ribulose-5-phosphate 4-epimerase